MEAVVDRVVTGAHYGLRDWLAQRITARYHLNPLSSEETAGYVKHRMRVAGATADSSAAWRRAASLRRLIAAGAVQLPAAITGTA